MPAYLLLAFGLFTCLVPRGIGSEALTGIACRSVHLQYPAPESAVFYNEVRVDESADGSYFMACGFSRGYFGIQQRVGGSKVVLFSVWDPGQQNDPNAAPAARRVKVLDQGPDVVVKRFGGEGTGGQSFYEYDWKIGQTCRFVVTARLEGERTVYVGYFYVADEKRWQQLASFSTLAEGNLLRGYYSFVEDFRRNRVSTTQLRKATFGNGWVRSTQGKWLPLARAKFTADGNRALNIDAGATGDRFSLATGGDTANAGTPLWAEIVLPAAERVPQQDLPQVAGGE